MPVDFFQTLSNINPLKGLQFFPPQKAFQSIVQSYFLYHTEGDQPQKLAFSDGIPTLIFFLTPDHFCFRKQNEEVSLNGFLAGILLEKTYVLKPPSGAAALGIRLRPDGLYHLIRQPVSTLRGHLGIDISDLFGAAGSTLLRQLQDDRPIHEKLSVMEQFIRQQLSKKIVYDYRFAEVMQAFQNARRGENISALTRDMHLNLKWLERGFLRYLGIRPKEYTSTLRFLQAHSNLIESRGSDLMKVAVNNGYYDQSHFIRDFKRFTGQSPLSYLANYSTSDQR